MRVVCAFHPSTSLSLLRFYLKLNLNLNPTRQAGFVRGIHRGAALRQHSDEESTADSSSGSPDRQDDKDDKDDYYALLLSSPLPATNPTLTAGTIPSTAATQNISLASDPSETSVPEKPVTTRPRVIFGSRLAGPAARAKEGWGERRPEEPDNCCMSGCVNCVWDAYREEVEEWAARQRQRQGQTQLYGMKAGGKSKVSSDDGGGLGDLDGMEGGNIMDADEILKDLPVGIKEFIATEKRLKESKSMHGDGGLR